MLSDDPWMRLDEELAAWQAAGETATLWWRDDDATRPGTALDSLLDLAQRYRLPLALAVIPAGMDDRLPDCLSARAAVSVLQHGYAHRDYAASDEPGAELGEHRPAAQVVAELERGWSLLARSLGPRLLPVLVPPFNRIAESLLPALAPVGFRGLSRFTPRPGRESHGLVLANCHVDPVDWKRGSCFRGEARTLGELISHLKQRRTGRVDAAEATGLLTHHAAHDGATWQFLERLLAHLGAHPGVRWLGAGDIFPS